MSSRRLLSGLLSEIAQDAVSDEFESFKESIEKHLMDCAKNGQDIATVAIDNNPVLYYRIKQWLDSELLTITVLDRFVCNKLPARIAVHIVDLGGDIDWSGKDV